MQHFLDSVSDPTVRPVENIPKGPASSLQIGDTNTNTTSLDALAADREAEDVVVDDWLANPNTQGSNHHSNHQIPDMTPSDVRSEVVLGSSAHIPQFSPSNMSAVKDTQATKRKRGKPSMTDSVYEPGKEHSMK